jgi:signal transduction histidine kinase
MLTRHRRRAGNFGFAPGLFLLLLVLLPLMLMPAQGPDSALTPLMHALVFGFALAGAVALPLPDPAKAWSVVGLGLCAVGAVCALPNLPTAKMPMVAPVLHVLGVVLIGAAFVVWSHKAFAQPGIATVVSAAVSAPAAQIQNTMQQSLPPPPTPAALPPAIEAQRTVAYAGSNTVSTAGGSGKVAELEQRIKDMTADLEFLEELDRGLMNTVPAQVLILSSQLRVKLCNNQFREFFRLAPDEENGKDLQSLLPNKELLKTAQEAVGAKDVKEIEIRHYVKKAGEKRLLARIYGGVDGNLILCLQELVEVTAENMNRLPKTQIINVQSEKLQLAGGLFDDMENAVLPGLDGIKGTIESLVHRTDVPATVREALESARVQVLGLQRMVKTFSKFAEQHLEVAEQIGLVPTVDGALDPKNYSFELTGISITKDFGLKRPKVEASEKQLRQAFINLFTNAFEAIRRRGGQGQVVVKLLEENGRAKVTIEDNGGGMAADQLKAAFKGQYSTKSGGAGLGIVTAQRIVQGSKGNITGSTTEGTGSTFAVELPII